MEKWQWTAIILCGFGLFKEFRPSEPFVTEYLISYKNISHDDVVHVAYPISTYSYLGTLAIVFLVTDFLRYRIVIILEGLAFVATWCLLIWGKGLSSLIIVEVLYGLASSTEVAYYTYIYAKVDKDKFQRVTGYTYAAALAGKFFAALVSQLLVSNDVMDYYELNFISLASMVLSLVFAFLLPKVRKSIYFDRISETSGGAADNVTFFEKIKLVYPILWNDFKSAFSNSFVIKWSLWWTVAMAIYLQVMNYIQAMWETISSHEENDIYNGAVEAVHTALSAVMAFGVGYVKLPWDKWGDGVLGISSSLAGVSLIVVSTTGNIYVAYGCYIFFRTVFQVAITIASSEVAQKIKEDSHGLIFGINTFVALCFQTILTLVVADSKGLELPEPTQFLIYGSCFALLGCLYLVLAVARLFRNGCTSK